MKHLPDFVCDDIRLFEDAVFMNNDVPQGLSSCILQTDVCEAEKFYLLWAVIMALPM